MIKTEKLSKSFGSLQAVNEVSLKISDNSIFGLAGTNGAGKSTLLRMLAGVLKQDSGTIFIDNKPVYYKGRNFLFAGCSLFFSKCNHERNGSVLCHVLSKI